MGSLFLLTACLPTTLTASPTALPAGTAFRDDFSSPASGWLVASSPVGEMNYYQGTFRITVTTANYDLWTLSGRRYRDVHLEVDAGRLAGPFDNRFGLICRYRDPYNFYFFIISSDGYFGVGKVSGGNRILFGGQAMTVSPAILTGVAPNHLAFDCIGDHLAASVNGQEIATFRDGDHAEGEVGLLAGSFTEAGVDIIFDNFSAAGP
ncbi:MAG: hypothetical protein ABWK53_06985 [Anaerolineales bacterium]